MLCRFPVVLSPADNTEDASGFHPLLTLTVISQPGLAQGQTYYPLISFQISKSLQVLHCLFPTCYVLRATGLSPDQLCDKLRTAA